MAAPHGKILAVTQGEPGGVGPEIIVKALAGDLYQFHPLVVADASVMEEAARSFVKPPLKVRVIRNVRELKGLARPGGIIDVLHTPLVGGFKKGAPTAGGGRHSYQCIKKAAELALRSEVHAVCTAPISKEALKMAGIGFPGHTEMLASLSKTKKYAMMLAGGPLRVVLATIHIALRDVPAQIKKKNVLEKIILAAGAARMFGIKRPHIAVCGLNPHAGEGGLFGREEISEITPAIKKARAMRIGATGPHPADSVFHKALRGEVDIVLAMYHDQGLAPLKAVAFETGVNITVGLPIIRTSPDHGTAYDIAWKGTASPESMISAIKMAAALKKIRADKSPL